MLKMPEKITIAGPVGGLDTIVVMAKGPTRGIAVVAHPNPLQGGTHTNKVVQTCAKSLSQLGYTVYCPNLRGVGASEGEHDYGRGMPTRSPGSIRRDTRSSASLSWCG